MSGWVVDTCVLIDVLEEDDRFGVSSARCLDGLLEEGLVVCPVSYVELAPAFDGDAGLQGAFLVALGASWHEPWTWPDTVAAHSAWARFIERRRRAGLRRRPIADILIGAFACRHAGLVTRNPDDFRDLFPSLPLRVPGAPEP